MPKVNIWNTIAVAQTGRLKLQDAGRELFGTVVKHGVNDKTVSVRICARRKNTRYIKWLYSTSTKQVHDQLNYCVTGDKVIIGNCQPISNTKHYYIKSIVKAFGRQITPKGQINNETVQTKNIQSKGISSSLKQELFEIPNPQHSKFISLQNLRHGSENISKKKQAKKKIQQKLDKINQKKKQKNVAKDKKVTIKNVVNDNQVKVEQKSSQTESNTKA